MSTTQPHLFLFGAGYVAQALARRLRDQGWKVRATARNKEKASILESRGISAVMISDLVDNAAAALAGSTHWLVSAAPCVGPADGPDLPVGGDPFLAYLQHLQPLAGAEPSWLGYLSTTGVYGDSEGAWVDEDTEVAPSSARTQNRVLAEQGWLELATRLECAGHIFRLGGIYGPGRSALDRIRAGRGRLLIKEGKVFNRIHVDDIVTVLLASMQRPRPGGIYNVVDGNPLSPQSVMHKAYELLKQTPPPEERIEDVTLDPLLAKFYVGNTRVRSRTLTEELGVQLRHRDAIEGLLAIWNR